jgi:AcrR family transcriptional regulator
MNIKELKTEQIIIKAAEAEFFEKGYGNARTVSIANRACVNHSILHYYFRTKEQLFQKIFEEKVHTLIQMFSGIFEQKLDFKDTMRFFIETQFNFVAQNPQLPRFVFNEIISNEANRNWAVKTLSPQLLPFMKKVEKMLKSEIAKGNVRHITIRDLIMNIISVNISSFIAMPVIKTVFNINSDRAMKNMLNKRRESNVQFILNAICLEK